MYIERLPSSCTFPNARDWVTELISTGVGVYDMDRCLRHIVYCSGRQVEHLF